MSIPGTPNLVPAGGPAVPTGDIDANFSQRIGIGLAVSLAVNFALFAGAGWYVKKSENPLDQVKATVTLATPAPSATPTVAPTATPTATPSATPTPVPSATATPTPAPSATPSAAPSATPRPEATPTPRPVASATPVATPAPATPKPVPTKLEQKVTDTVKPTPIPEFKTSVPTPKPNQPVVQRTAEKVIEVKDPTKVIVDPNLKVTPEETIRALKNQTTPTRKLERVTSSAPVQKVRESVTRPTSVNIAAPTPNRTTAATEMRRSSTTAAAAAAAAPAPINPNVVQPIVESTFAGSSRQLKTVAGVASRIAGRTSVVAMTARSSTADPTFTVPAGGQLRAGQVTARQGSSASGATVAISGTPTAIIDSGEYAVYAPGAPERGPVGVRGNSSSIKGATVTALGGKGKTADVKAGEAVYADAPGGNLKGAEARKAAAAVGATGELSAAAGNGVGPVGSTGTDRSGKVTAGSGAGIKEGVGTTTAGGDVKGGTGGVRAEGGGGGGTSGALRVGVDVQVVKAGTAVAEKVEQKTDKTTITDAGKPEVKTGGDITNIEEEAEEISSTTGSNTVAAKSSGKPTFDPSDDLRQTRFSGSIEVKVTIDADGTHSEEILKGTGNAAYDRYIRDFFSKWKWEPAKLDGKPVRSVKIVRFKIN